jgi:hypothetical protein
MSESYRALSSDFYVNQKLALKLDLPRERQTVLDLCDRVRRQFPAMTQFRRYRDELALESEPSAAENRWMAIRNQNIRSGVVNPDSLAEAYALHRHLLEVAPYFLGISPLDVDYLELLFGFDVMTERNHDEVVFEALVAGSPLARLLDMPGATAIDCQPLLGVIVRDAHGRKGDSMGEVELTFEVKTRNAAREGKRGDASSEPISIYLTLRKYGPVSEIKDLPEVLDVLAFTGEEQIDSRVVPSMIVPIRDAAGSSST